MTSNPQMGISGFLLMIRDVMKLDPTKANNEKITGANEEFTYIINIEQNPINAPIATAGKKSIELKNLKNSLFLSDETCLCASSFNFSSSVFSAISPNIK